MIIKLNVLARNNLNLNKKIQMIIWWTKDYLFFLIHDNMISESFATFWFKMMKNRCFLLFFNRWYFQQRAFKLNKLKKILVLYFLYRSSTYLIFFILFDSVYIQIIPSNFWGENASWKASSGSWSKIIILDQLDGRQ